MTDKQIIIDGIDVSNCEHYDEVCLGNHHYKWCKDNEDCYYKQLKRAEQRIVELNKTIQAKEQECEELKEEIVNRNEKIEELRFSVSDLTNRLCDLNAEKSFRIVDLEQTITEIKEIARVNSINTCWTAINLCVDCDEIKECGLQSPFEKLKAIIQKISECEGNDGK